MWVIYEYWFARMKNISDSKKKKLREAYGSAKEIYYIEETDQKMEKRQSILRKCGTGCLFLCGSKCSTKW